MSWLYSISGVTAALNFYFPRSWWSYCDPCSWTIPYRTPLIMSRTRCKKLQNKQKAWQGWHGRLAQCLALLPCQLPFKLNLYIYDDRSWLLKQLKLRRDLFHVRLAASSVTCMGVITLQLLRALGDIKIDAEITKVVRSGRFTESGSNSLDFYINNTIPRRVVWEKWGWTLQNPGSNIANPRNPICSPGLVLFL